jgi:hypothetical protein
MRGFPSFARLSPGGLHGGLVNLIRYLTHLESCDV